MLALGADVAQEPEARRAVDDAARHFGTLHTLVNVAGIRFYTPLADADTKEWEQIIGVNLLATTYCCKAALPHLRRAGNATIVNVSSVFGVIGRAGMGQYDTTKAAILGQASSDATSGGSACGAWAISVAPCVRSSSSSP